VLVYLSPGVEIVALIPTLGDDPESLADTIRSLETASGEHRLGVLVVVNAPSFAMSKLDDRVSVVLAGLNLGWPGALMFARTLVEAPLLWLIQDDMTVEPNALEELLGALGDDPSLALVSPTVVRNGEVPVGSSGGHFETDALVGTPVPASDVPVDEYLEPTELSFVASRGMLVRTAAWDAVGGMDPRYYPLQWADVDLCFSLTAVGLRFRSVPQARVHHLGSVSTGQYLREFLLARNHELFASKWRSTSWEARPYLRHSTRRPTRASSLNGVVDPRISPELLAIVAQSAGDAFLHLGRVAAPADQVRRA
jgi:GT2 family glycosyltransferase